jgi:hypothetical protein
MSGYSNETFYHIGSRLMAAFSAPHGFFSEACSISSERARSGKRNRAKLPSERAFAKLILISPHAWPGRFKVPDKSPACLTLSGSPR